MFGRCVGAENARSYFIFTMSSYLILTVVIFMMLTSGMSLASCLFLELIEGVVKQWLRSKFLFIAMFIPLAFIQITLFDNLLWMGTAITNGLTLRELRTIWNHKHCFKIRSADENEEEEAKSYYMHKNPTLRQMIQHTIDFFKGGQIAKAKKSSKRVVVNKRYADLSSTSRSNVSYL